MKRLKNSLTVSAITVALGMFFFVGCSDKDDESPVTQKTINGIECVLVEKGTFYMGSQESEREKPNDEVYHKVTLTRNFWIGKYPVTNEQYGREVSDDRKKHPVVNVTWADAKAFAESKGGFLPTEAQWEYAARGGNKSKGYKYSGGDNLDEVAWYEGNSGWSLRTVGTKKANELGIYDMTGNVWEWLSDFYNSYGVEENTGTRTDPDIQNVEELCCGEIRNNRGGSYDTGESNSRIAYREASQPGYSGGYTGFRVIFYD
ncbi:MAG: formylglycine-generating enzyme family protein [Chitinivibrionia bacterium]|nr:formylglycine-generating enzyme family protein [Chitinivibrionia bacterium]MCL1946141.1 formylglycine-generating enzyme family protein [Chitinivibrionia bacterium]